MKWLKWIGGAILAFLLAIVTLGASTRKEGIESRDKKEADRLNKGIADDLKKADEHLAKADVAIKAGIDANEKIDKELEERKQDEAVDAIADKFNVRRVRRSSDGKPT